MNKTTYQKRLTVFLILLPGLLIGIILMLKTQQYLGSQRQIIPEDKEVLRRWEALLMTPVENSPSFSNSLMAIPRTVNVALSEREEAQLTGQLFSLIMAHFIGDYETFRKFRTPVEARMEPTRIGYLKEMLKGSFLQRGEPVPDDLEAVYRLYFERRNSGKGYTNYWKGVALSNSFITVEAYSSAPPSITEVIAQTPNVGVITTTPAFIFENTPADILREYGTLKCATVYLVVEHARPDPVFPVCYRLYWDPKTSKWLWLEAGYSLVGTSERAPIMP
jgi:hypothetical protein